MNVVGPHCDGCINQSIGQRRVEPQGNGASGIMLVGDSPWVNEIAAGKPFVGAAGGYLDRQLRRLGIERSSLVIANSMCCKPPHLGWTDHLARYPEAISALRQCQPYMNEAVAKYKPRAIVPMGVVAMRQVCGFVDSIEARHSYVHETGYGVPAIPTFHPSFLMQGKQKYTSCLLFALARAREIANGTFEPTRYELLLDPTVEQGWAYLNRRASIPILMLDIETPESRDIDEEDLEEAGASYVIERAGFSHTDGTAISFPFREGYIELLQEAINRAALIGEWADNHFDTRRLRANGIRIPESARVISPMWAWHFLQSDLLKGLGFVAPFYYKGPAWKHLSHVQEAYYNAMDNAVSMTALLGIMRDLEREGRWDIFMRHCVEADSVLVRMGAVGVQVNSQRQAAFRGKLEDEAARIYVEIQPQVPDSVRLVDRWKKRMPWMEGLIGLDEIDVPDTRVRKAATATGAVAERAATPSVAASEARIPSDANKNVPVRDSNRSGPNENGVDNQPEEVANAPRRDIHVHLANTTDSGDNLAAYAAQEGRVDDRLTDADRAMASPSSGPIASSVHAMAAPAHPKGSAKVAIRVPKPLANYRWARKQPFNPRSHDQTISLIKALGIKPPRSRDDEDSETAQAKHLRKFGMKHRVFMDILRYRQRMTMLSNYDWQLDENGRIHTTYGFHPSTWRKSSRAYNLQTIPKRNELADAFRQQIEAADGCYLIEADSSAIEAVLVGYDAGSPGYIKLAKAGLHGWMTAAYHKEPIPIDAPDLAKRCKAAKRRWPVDYEVLKRVNHLSNYLGTPEKIYEEYPEEFTSVAMAADMQRFIFSTEPGQEVRRWQRNVMNEAHAKCHLLNHWKYKHYFYCLAPDTKIIRSDLSWVPIESINIGDEIIGFDENVPRTGKGCSDKSPMLRKSIVTSKETMIAPRMAITTDRGTVIATPGHGWLVRIRRRKYCVHRWVTTEYLEPGDEIVYFTQPWEANMTPDAQWLAGILDGEGTVWKPMHQFRGGLHIAQNPGMVFDRIMSVSAQLGLSPIVNDRNGYKTKTITLRCSGLRSVLQILGQLRPIRLIQDADKTWDNTPLWHSKSMIEEVATVRSVIHVAPGPVVAIGTNTKTLIADGLCSHNSVYDWNWKRRDWDLGEDAKRAVAFGPQSDGSAFQTDVLLRLAANERMAEWLRLIIHDSIVIEVPEDNVEWAAQQLYDEMTRPVPELNGLVIGAELKYGRNLGAMSDSNPAGMQEIAIEGAA